jgi:sarcosine oxidase, subunit gamma
MITKKSPLGGISIGSVATVAIRELPGLHTTDLRVAPGTPAHGAVTEALGMDLPAKLGQATRGSVSREDEGREGHSLCLGPDRWLMVGFPEAEKQLVVLLLNNEDHVSAVDVSGQRTIIELEGPNAREVLAHLWDQDLREKAFPVASVSQGLMAKSPVIVWHIAPFRYRVMVQCSFALHLWKALVDGAEEWM